VTYALDGLERETSYQAALRAIDEAGNVGPLSNIVFFRTEDRTAPGAVTSLAARERTSNSIRLTWLAPGDDGLVGQATRYDLRLATAPISEENFDKAQPVEGIGPPETAGTNETFTVTGLNGDTSYSFALKSFDEAGNGSALSNVIQAQTEGPVPELLSATLVEPRTARLQWVFSGTTPSFRIERAVGTDPFEEIAAVPGTLFQFSDPTLAPATSYSYRVRAEVDEALTAPSNTLSVTTADEPPVCVLSPDALDFGLVSLGADSVRTFFVRNGGGGLLEGSAIGSCEDFHILNPQGFALGAGDSVGIAVWFTPTQVRDEACALEIGGCGAAVSVRGGGDGPPTCAFSTSSLDFDDVPVGSAAEQSYEIRNLGGGVLEGAVTLGGCPAFEVVAGATFAIPRLGTHEVTIRFSPTTTGSQACAGFHGAGCAQLFLLGNGIFCTTSPTDLEFGAVPSNQFSTRSLTIQNVSDRRASFSLQEDNGTGCIAFSVGTIDQFFDLDAGASRTIDVNFFAQIPRTYNCVLRVRYAFGTGAPTICTEVPLSATAQ
ncbi:MAG: choice-of-anchor D domain-containing protein, partial [Candidatus Eisenbacteria bacterium]|nr:choice-of-anchor D domain-containing protein [Candidatus Eisenbacteria bacterium]